MAVIESCTHWICTRYTGDMLASDSLEQSVDDASSIAKLCSVENYVPCWGTDNTRARLKPGQQARQGNPVPELPPLKPDWLRDAVLERKVSRVRWNVLPHWRQ